MYVYAAALSRRGALPACRARAACANQLMLRAPRSNRPKRKRAAVRRDDYKYDDLADDALPED